MKTEVDKSRARQSKQEAMGLVPAQAATMHGISLDTSMDAAASSSAAATTTPNESTPSPARKRACQASYPPSRRFHKRTMSVEGQKEALKVWLGNPNIPEGEWNCECCAKQARIHQWPVPAATIVLVSIADPSCETSYSVPSPGRYSPPSVTLCLHR